MNKQNTIFFQQIFLIFILLFFCISLFACQSKKETILEKSDNSKNYKTTYYDMDNNFNAIWQMHYFFDNLYIAANTISKNTVICKYNKEGTLLEEIPLEVKKDISILDFHISEDGDMVCLITNNPWNNLESSANPSSFIKSIHFNQKGEKLSSTKLKFPYERNCEFEDCGLFMEDSRIALVADQKIFLFDQDGNLLNQDKIKGICPCICLEPHGNLSILSELSSEYVVNQLSASSEKISKEYKTSLPIFGRYWIKAADKDSNYDFIAASTKGIYGYSYKTKKTTSLFQWIKLNIVIQDGRFLDFSCLEEDSFAVLVSKPKGLRLLIVELQEENTKQQEKKELVLYDYYGNDSIKYGIIAWNEQREDAKISIKENVSRTQLALDIVSGNGPDILCFSSVDMFWDSYIKKGYFSDYDTLMKQMPEGLQKKDLLENLSAIYEKTYGKLYFFPTSFFAEILAGSKQDFPEKEQWTLKEFNTLMEKNIPIKFIENDFQSLTGKMSLFETLFFHALPDFYDTISGLNVDKFKELLDFVVQWTSEENKTADKSLLYSNIVDSWGIHSVLKNIETIYGKNNYQLLGYPCETGTGISIQENGVFAIVANENSSIAWDFVQSFYSYEAQNYGHPADEEHPYSSAYNGIPVRKDVFNERFKYLKSSNYYEGLSKKYSATKKEIDMLKSYIEQADRINRYRVINNSMIINNSLSDILNDELNAYFDGEKTQEEILPIIENRVNLYNKEQEE